MLTVAYVAVSALILAVFSQLLYGQLLIRIKDSIDEQVVNAAAQELFLHRAAGALQTQIIITDAITLVLVFVCGYVLTYLTLRPIRSARDRERRFLADAAHELRTPLAVMKSGLEVAVRGEKNLSDRIKKQLTLNIDEIDSLTRIANGLLALSREKDVRPRSHITIDVLHMIQTVVNALTPLAIDKGVTVAFARTETLVPTLVLGDPDTLRRAFENVIENAIKYSTKGGQVHITLMRQHATAQIIIRDTGIGISASDLQNVTEPFYRADSARSTGEGSGLGLSIVSETIKAHTGLLQIESELGVGTSVCITLTLAPAKPTLS